MSADHDALAQWSMSHWSQRHDGYDPGRSRLVRAWLRGMHDLATPLARAGVAPTALTLAGVCAAGAAVKTAAVERPAAMAAALVLATAVCDGLDGAVALRRIDSGRPPSRHGTAIDHAADRITDALFAVALARAGASRGVATTAAVATLGYEAVRSLLRRNGHRSAIVTVGERPIRVGVVCAGLLAAPSAGAAAVVTLSAGALAQIAVSAPRSKSRGAAATC